MMSSPDQLLQPAKHDIQIAAALCLPQPQVVPEVVRVVKTADIIMLQCIGYSEEQRAVVQNALNEIAAPVPVRRLQGSADQDLRQKIAAFTYLSAREFRGSGKQLLLIGMSSEHPDYDQAAKASRPKVNEKDYLRQSTGTLLPRLRSSYEATARSCELGDRHIVSQVEEIATNVRQQGLAPAIGIICTAARMPIATTLQQQGYSVQAERVGLHGTLTYAEQAFQQLRDNEPISTLTLQRAILHNICAAYNPLLVRFGRMINSYQRYKADEALQNLVIDLLSPSAVNDALVAFDNIKDRSREKSRAYNLNKQVRTLVGEMAIRQFAQMKLL